MAEDVKALIFTYGTLKRGFGNHRLMEELISSSDAVFMGPHVTQQPLPLVVGPHGVPYLINLPGSGQRVKGELYAVSNRGLSRLDELEGVRIGHYERLPIQACAEEKGGDGVEAEAYFAHRSFAEKLWERKGKSGMCEYGIEAGKKYVRREDRAKGYCIIDDLNSFVQNYSS